jgi:hypothetical protein
MKFQHYLIFVLLFVILSVAACNPEAVKTPEAPTEVSVEEATTAPTSEPAATPVAEEEAAEPTTAPTDTPPPAEEPAVQVQALTTLNLRSGPGTNYGVAGSLAENTELSVIGRNEDSSWLYVETVEGDEVWLTGDPELVKVDQALVANLPVVEAPPPSYNASNPMVNKVLNQVPLVVHHDQNITCASHSGLNKLLPEVRDGNVLGPHAGDFVYDGNNVLFKLTGGSIVLIRENPVARFEGGAESLPLDKALQLFESGDIVWNGDFGQPGRGVLGCDLSTP